MEEEENPENYHQNNNNENNNINNNNQENEGSQEEENLEDNDDNKLMYIYEWVDSIPLSRQKKNISRDFNDAVLLAEMIKYHYPRLVDLHNYPSASSTKAKLVNWETLNKKVLKKLGVKITKNEINDIINSKPNAIENLLGRLHHVIHGIPQEPTNTKKNENFVQQNNSKQMNSHMMNENEMLNEESNELISAINEKDQEIANLKEYIETLEQKLKDSNEKQNQLELKIKELNSLLLQ